MAEETPAPQEVKLELQLDLTQQQFDYTSDWIAHFESQEAPQIAGVDPNKFRSDAHPGHPGEEGETRYA